MATVYKTRWMVILPSWPDIYTQTIHVKPEKRAVADAPKLRSSANWVGKSSDFTNPYVCGPAGGKVKKMSSSSSSSVCYICRQQYI